MRPSPKTLLSTLVLVCVIGAGIFLRASSMREASSVQVASSATAAQSNAVATVQILEEQLAYTTAEVARLETQLAVSQERASELTARLRAARGAAGI
jgi:TolA-binding protein